MTEYLPKIKKLPKRECIEVKGFGGIGSSRTGQGYVADGHALRYRDGALGVITPRCVSGRYDGGRGLFALGEHLIVASSDAL